MTPRTVYIVGAGPGDPLLISVRGLRCIRQADVIVHDHAVHHRLLRSASPQAELIDVGSPSPQPLEQEAICLLMAEKARDGKNVVRLKWGDPFVFDSGGRAALFLREQGVPFEVVPGVPALVAVPAYAGIPVSYPGSGDTVTLIRGFEDQSQTPPKVDWTSLAKLRGALVCYAGAEQLGFIVNALLSHGRPASDRAAVIYDGTLPQQSAVDGTLGDIVAKASTHGRQAGILVVGPVAGLRDHLRWFDARPLFGRRIIVTRSREQAGELVERLEELGAEAIEASSIRVEPVVDVEPMDRAIAEMAKFDWLVFVSANGVDHFMRHLMAGPHDVRALAGPRICAVGASVADRLARYRIKVDVVPSESQTEAIIEAMRERHAVRGSRILLVHAEGVREKLGDDLLRHQGVVTEVGAYRTLRNVGGDGDPDIFKMLLDREIDAVTFTSPTSVSNFVQTLGPEPAADLLRTVVVASIGPVTAEAALQMGISTTIMPSEYTTDALVEAIVRHFAGQRERQPAAG
jgi:uroporphyrinogen III methyltransferase/synthase